jgi:hypothetical protein
MGRQQISLENSARRHRTRRILSLAGIAPILWRNRRLSHCVGGRAGWIDFLDSDREFAS